MAELKTKPTSEDVAAFVATLDDEQERDSRTLIGMMQNLTGAPAVMWGTSIIGFGDRHLKYESGRELDWFVIGFSPRKGKLAVYCPVNLDDHVDELEQMGKHKRGKGCLYITRLADIDEKKLETFLKKSVS